MLIPTFDPLPQPLSHKGRGEQYLALLPWWEKGWEEGDEIDARGLMNFGLIKSTILSQNIVMVIYRSEQEQWELQGLGLLELELE